MSSNPRVHRNKPFTLKELLDIRKKQMSKSKTLTECPTCGGKGYLENQLNQEGVVDMLIELLTELDYKGMATFKLEGGKSHMYLGTDKSVGCGEQPPGRVERVENDGLSIINNGDKVGTIYFGGVRDEVNPLSDNFDHENYGTVELGFKVGDIPAESPVLYNEEDTE